MSSTMPATLGSSGEFFFAFTFIKLHRKICKEPFCAHFPALRIMSSMRTSPIHTKETVMLKHTAAVLLSLASSQTIAADTTPVPYPEGYRNWQHVKSMVIQPGHPLHEAFGGIHHLYANAKAMAGYRSGKYPNGAIIVFDLLEARSTDNAITEGNRKVVGVMHFDARKYAATGGWGFEGFKGDSKTERAVGANAKSACFDCHTSQQDTTYVFSRPRP